MTPQTDVVDAGRAAQPLLETLGLTKAFGPVEVLSDISLAFHAGEVHAIIGENGAGKSTLMKIISGHLDPTRGSLRFDGAPLTLRGPVDAERRGIVLVHQEIMLAPDLSVAENMFLGRELRRGVAVDDRTMNARAEEAMRVFGVDVSVTVPVQRLSIARRQLAQIARALATPHRIVIFDEPTASLTPVETGGVAQAHPRTQGERGRGHLHLAPSGRGQSDRRRRHRAARRQVGGDLSRRRIAAGRHGASDGRARPAGALSAALARADRRARLRRLAASARRVSRRTRASRCGRAKFSAFPAWSGRAAPSCSRRCSACARAAARSASTARPQRWPDARSAMDAGAVYLTEDRKSKGLLLEETVGHQSDARGA